ncbi:MAG TPA: biotin transporter BioY [Dictyobacter sp.]|jgi:biotin transport system substrate-specific component|nr:biotin transporter BioY [Dictyobacter sp.]
MAIAPGTTLADQFIPARISRTSNLVKDGMLVIGGSALLALCSQVIIPLPFTPIPLTLQTFVVLLIGATLGGKRGLLTSLLYLLEGVAGLPVFAAGASGLAHLTGPSAGYLWAMPIVAYVVGILCERGMDRKYSTAVIAMLIGTIIVYICGVSWLSIFTHSSLYVAFLEGMVPFIPGDLIKIIVAVALLPTTWRIVRQIKSTSAN